MMQRTLDVTLAGLALLLLMPLLALVAVVLKLTGEGDIFYSQERVGLAGKHFKLLKFATMLRDSPKLGARDITLKNDPRVLPVGRFLRKSKLNELPQLWNVLTGDMSLVGPRPMVPATLAHYPQSSRELIISVRPGLTGIGSIVFRDEERFLAGSDAADLYHRVIIPYKSEAEAWYVQQASTALYFRVLIATALVILSPDSAATARLLSPLPPLPKELRERH